MHICFNIKATQAKWGHTNKIDSEYLKNNVWIYVHTSDLDQGAGSCEVFDSFAVVTIKNSLEIV